MLSSWSDKYGLSALCRKRDPKYEKDTYIPYYETVHVIIMGSSEDKQVSYDEVKWLKENGNDDMEDDEKTELPDREMSLFENEDLTHQLLRVMLTPRLYFVKTENEMNCIYLEIHLSFLELMEDFIKSIQCYGCAWMNQKHEGFTKLNLNYLESKGGVLNHLKEKKARFDFSNAKIEENILCGERRWYYRLIRTKRFYDENRFRKLNDFKQFIWWKWVMLWLPLAVNEDVSNVFDLNRYLIKYVTNKYKIRLDWKDIYEYLCIHICQLIPDTLKHKFNHKLNLASPIFLTFLNAKENSKDMWFAEHNGLMMPFIYTKIFRYANCLLGNAWYREYLLKAIELPNVEFEILMEGNNLINAWEYKMKLDQEDEHYDDESAEINIKEKWSLKKAQKVLEICSI